MQPRFTVPIQHVDLDRLVHDLTEGRLAAIVLEMGAPSLADGLALLREDGSYGSVWGETEETISIDKALSNGQTVLYPLSEPWCSQGQMALCLDGERRPVADYLHDDDHCWLAEDSTFVVCLSVRDGLLIIEVGVATEGSGNSHYEPGAPPDIIRVAVRVLNGYVDDKHRIDPELPLT